MVLNSKCWFLYGHVLPTGAIGPVGTHRTDYSHSDPQCIATAWYLSIVDLLATAWYRLVYTECYSVLSVCVFRAGSVRAVSDFGTPLCGSLCDILIKLCKHAISRLRSP